MIDNQERLELHIPVQAQGNTAVSLLAGASGLSHQAIKQAMVNGAVWLSRGSDTRRLRRAKRPLVIGDELHLYYDRGIQATRPRPARLIADEGAYSVWFKPSGMYSQGSRWGDHCTVCRWSERQLQRTSFPVHRLDRAASGLILIAHSRQMARELSKLFEQRQVKKTYLALVAGAFSLPVGSLLSSDIDGKSARTFVSLRCYDASTDTSILKVEIETGRKHQIRRHLAECGFPIIGDRLFGGPLDAPLGDELNLEPTLDLQLCAWQLAFNEPETGEQKAYTASDSLLPPALVTQS
ncbi:MAG TPA: RNA pseudouridine synthase [Porticoccaceae bacterium]|nr:RNA pseudouridine synthase [Porticoccaceae bacterium]HCO61726.1 RNA pseudouridine synthase [Porticoccaceae bacterium]